ncbi:unnamed protein product [Candidula unifasciata]|uniref:Sulfatase-modifying factor enzyme-like domain-containing protein n=1 Tax=Candidula unifasciata TaxID=100452 RepID=A0A8S4A3L4_9EUPU|nr:unnamed protein product [Candidula unifasciata]
MDILTGKRTFSSLRPLDLSLCTKQQITDYFNNSYDLNESIFLGLKDETVFYKCPDRLRLPLVFYYGHTAAVYVNKLMLVGLIKERINLDFETIFETGVDEMSWDDTENYRMGGSYKWPAMSKVVEYRRAVRNLILKVIEDTPLVLPVTMESPWWALMMGMEHERIHLETSSVLIRQLPKDMVECPEGYKYGPLKTIRSCNKWLRIKELENVSQNKPADFPSYGWDNEYGEVVCNVPPFEASQFLTTNAAFLEFVERGGYMSQDLWTEEGWMWVQYRQARHPSFWVCDQGCKSGCGADLASYSHCKLNFGQLNEVKNGLERHKKAKHSNYKLRVMFNDVDMPWDWPVEVNYHEAKAFCKWKGQGYRLPIEAEHHAMRGPQLPTLAGTASDIIFQEEINANLNLQYGSSTPVNMFPPTKAGFYDVFGNTWEWMEDHFNGLDCFNSHFLYDDFSSPCFDGKHNVILGGSWISTGDAASRFGRYAFRRHFFQHSGFRLARSLTEKVDLPARVVDTEVFVLGSGVQANKPCLDSDLQVVHVKSTHAAYNLDTLEALEGILELEFGYRESFAAVVADLCKNYCSFFHVSTSSAVHLGSATGRGSFELSKHFCRVLGVETCGRLIDAAMRLKAERYILYKGAKEIRIGDKYNLDRIVFKQLTWIPNEVDSHDLVLITHLDRVQNPKAWLVRLWEITKPKGIVVIASKDGNWDKKKLNHHLCHRLKCISSQEVPFEDASGEGTATVTVWRHK